MIRFIALLATLLISTSTLAGMDLRSVKDAGFDKLSAQQQAEVLSMIANSAEKTETAAQTVAGAASAAVNAVTPTPKGVSEWLDVGQKIGQMMGGAAKEVGVAVNDFVKTPVGQWTMAIIVWKFMGGVIMHAVGAILVLITGFGTVVYLIRSVSTVEKEYGEPRVLFGFLPIGRPVTKYKRTPPLNDNGQADGEYVATWVLASLFTLIAALVTLFTY